MQCDAKHDGKKKKNPHAKKKNKKKKIDGKKNFTYL
jgi:hypothetical protein